MPASEISEIQAIRDVLARWSIWARQKVLPRGYAGETVEYVLMRFGTQPPKATGWVPEPENKEAEAVEQIVISMPRHLKQFIIAEFIIGGPPKARARATHTSVPQYYKELHSALWWLHGDRRLRRFI